MARMVAADTTLRSDARFALYPAWLSRQVTGGGRAGGRGGRGGGRGGGANQGAIDAMIVNAQNAGALVVAGTDTPNAANVQAEVIAYVAAGMTPFEALKTATVNSAQALRLNVGTVEAGRLADLVILDGNPLQDITATYRVVSVVANGVLRTRESLLGRD